MLSACEAPEGGALASSITCSASGGGADVDVTPHTALWYVLGSGYEGAFGACSQKPMVTGQYGFSHAGGMFVEHYDELTPSGQLGLSSYIKAISAYGTLSDLLHDAEYDYTCSPRGYLHDPANYTCGLQHLWVAAGFPGSACKAVREACAEDAECAQLLTDAASPALFDASSGLGEHFTAVRGLCGSAFGAIAVFPLIKQMEAAGKSDAFVRVSVPFALPPGGHGGMTKPRVELVTDKNLTGACTVKLVVQVGTPTCDDVIDMDGQFEETVEPSPDSVARYAMQKFGFAYSATAALWHRAGASGCELGCCDRCFQWHCPHTTSENYVCSNYTYECERANGEQTAYDSSGDQSCGERSKYLDDGEVKFAPRRRCGV